MRGAASPRSASPMGPAPTRLPRMALPLPTKNSFGGIAHRKVPGKLDCGRGTYDGCRAPTTALQPHSPVDQQTEDDDSEDPGDSEPDGHPVEVALDHGRPTERGGDATTEHVGKTAALPLVHQHQKDQQDTEKHHEDGQTEDHTLTRSATPKRGEYGHPAPCFQRLPAAA